MNSSGPRDSRATQVARGGGGVQCPPSPCPLRPSETASGEAREADTGEPGRGVVADGCWVGGGRARGAFPRCGPTSSPGTRVCVPDTDSGQRRTLRSGRGRGRVGVGMSLGAGRTRGRRPRTGRGDRATGGQAHGRTGFLGRGWGVRGSQVRPVSEAFMSQLNLSTIEQPSSVARCGGNSPGSSRPGALGRGPRGDRRCPKDRPPHCDNGVPWDPPHTGV